MKNLLNGVQHNCASIYAFNGAHCGSLIDFLQKFVNSQSFDFSVYLDFKYTLIFLKRTESES